MEMLKTLTQHPWEFAILVTAFWQDELQKELELKAQFIASDVNCESVELPESIKFDPIATAQNSSFSLMAQTFTTLLAKV